MGFKSWWGAQDNTSQWIVKVFAGLVVFAVVVSMIKCGA